MTTRSIYKSAAGEQAVTALYESLLARWPVPYTALDLPTRHGSTFAIVSGRDAAPPLVLLHGAGSNSAAWAGEVAAYSRHYRVVALDLLGEPGKSAPNRPAWDGPAYAEWLEDVLDALEIETASLIGLSQGGWTALKFAVRKPERVKALVVLSPGGIVPDKLSSAIRAIALSLSGRWGRLRLTRLVLGNQSVPKEVEEAITLIMTHFKTRIGVLPLFSDAELQRLTMPVLLLMGARDILRDAQRINIRMQKLVPHLTTTIVPEGGHALLNTTEDVLSFLASAKCA